MYKLVPLSALAIAAAPLQAEPSPEVFARLAQPVQAAPVSVEARAAAMPALSMLPQKTDSLIVLPDFARLIQSCGACASPGVTSIGCVAVSAGEGSAEMVRTFLSVIMHAQMAEMINLVKDGWLSTSKPEYAEMINGVFQAELEARAAKFKSQLATTGIAPIYAALTPAPGQESDFEAVCECLPMGMANIKETIEGAKDAEWQGFTGVELPRKAILQPLVMEMAMNDAEVEKALEGGSVYLLWKKVDKGVLVILCSDTSAISLPESATDSLLASPALNSADAHLSGQELAAAAWIAPSILQYYMELGRTESYAALAELTATAFDKLAAADAVNAASFQAAAEGVRGITQAIFPVLPKVEIPFSVTAWMNGDELCIQNISDAMGMHYAPGELRTATLADAPDTVLYLESTDLEVKTMGQLSGELSSTLLNIAKGFTLTTAEGVQDQIAPKLMMAEMFKPELISLGDAVNTVCSALEAPCSLVITEPAAGPTVAPAPMAPVAAPLPSVGFYAAVKNRAALADGWLKLAATAQQVANKCGGPQNIVSMLPVMPRALNGSAVNYALLLPLPFPALEPQLTVSDKSFMLGTSTALCDKMLSLGESPGVPFRGCAAKIQIAPLMRVLQTWLPNPAVCGAGKLPEGDVTLVSTDHEGAIISQYRVHLNLSEWESPSSVHVKMISELNDEENDGDEEEENNDEDEPGDDEP